MSTIVTRSGKGSPLTHNEVDTNFTNLNTDKVEKTAADITGGTINNTTVGATTPSTGVFTTLTAQNETLVGTGQNLLLYSEVLNDTSWTTNSPNVTISANATTAPNGTTTADKVIPTVTNTSHIIRQFITNYQGLSYVQSIYAKAEAYSVIQIVTSTGFDGGGQFYKNFLLSSGTLGNGTLPATITAVGSGWYRISVVATATSSSTGARFNINVLNADTASVNPSYAGDGTSGVYLWGGQLEIGTSVGTYIPTTTTAVYGTPTLSFSGVASIGLQSDGSLYETSAGTGNVRFYTNNIAQEQARVSHTASAVNYHQLTGSATGSGPIHSVAGSDTNIDLNLTTKGTGGARFNVGNGSKYTYLSSDSANNFQLIGAVNTSNLGIYATGGGNLRFYTAAGLLEEQLRISQTASAVNYVQVTGAATGGSPTISAQGSDASIDLALYGKGSSGGLAVIANNALQFYVSPTSSAVNRIQVTGSATAVAPALSAQGSDTNIPLVLQPKGTGALQAQQTDSTATGGNARGANAVDWSTKRDAGAYVASGSFSVLSGGASNVAQGALSFVGGGQYNTGGSSYSIQVGGFNNSTGGAYSFGGGGNTNVTSGQYASTIGGLLNNSQGYLNFIGGGSSNSANANAAVTTQSATMNGTTAVTLAASNANIKVGQLITGTSIVIGSNTTPFTYVAAISGTSLTLSQAASGSSTSTLSFFTPHGVVVGGGNNTATGSYSFIGGGGDAGNTTNRNIASGDWSVVVGGFKNTAIQAYTFIGGGNGNVASSSYSTVSGGSANGIYASYGTIAGGLVNAVTGFGASVVGGYSNSASGSYSVTGAGTFSTTRGINSMQVISGDGPISGTAGSAQSGLLILGRQTTDATATRLASDGNAAGTTNQVILPNNSAYYFKGSVIANVTGGGNTKAWAIEGAIKRGANAASTALVGTPTVTSAYADVGAATWAITATADTTNGGLAVTFTGQASTTIRCVAKLETTEVTF